MLKPELPQDGRPFLTRKEAVEFIRDRLGIPLSPSVLDKKCMRGEGPAVAGYWGKRELYTQQNLKDWAFGLVTAKPALIISEQRPITCASGNSS
jgi:hypothetical protein